MFNHVTAPMNTSYSLNKLKFGTEWTYVPLSWLGLGARYDVVEPNTSKSGESFSVISPRIIFRTAFVTHEQVMIQYSRYFYGDLYQPGFGPAAGYMSGSQFPYNSQPAPQAWASTRTPRRSRRSSGSRQPVRQDEEDHEDDVDEVLG